MIGRNALVCPSVKQFNLFNASRVANVLKKKRLISLTLWIVISVLVLNTKLVYDYICDISTSIIHLNTTLPLLNHCYKVLPNNNHHHSHCLVIIAVDVCCLPEWL